jgi:hypothetical protein
MLMDLIKNMVMQQIAGKVMGEASGAVAEQGAGAFVSMIQEKLTGGGIGDITSMFSGEGDGGNMVAGFQEKLGSIMQEQGVPAEEAASQASGIAPDLFNSVKEKFASTDAADSGFDLGALAGLAGGGGLGGMLDNAKDALGGNAADLLGKAKDLF